MARDDILDKELSELEKEIEAKVDSLFVEIEAGGGGAPAGEEEPWKRLKELFLTLEWEIEESTLLKICAEAEHLQSRFPEGVVGTLLGWIGSAAGKIRAQGEDVGQEGVQLLMDLKNALFQAVEDPFGDPGPLLGELRPRVERLLVGVEEEAPTITLEAAGSEEFLSLELERAVDETLGTEQEPAIEPAAAPEGALAWAETPHYEVPVEVEEALTETPGPEPPALKAEAEPSDQIDQVKEAISDCGRSLEQVVKQLSEKDPLGLGSALQQAGQRLQEMAGALEKVLASLREQLQTLWSLDLVVRPPEPEAPPEPQGVKEEVLFVSVSNRVFGIPMASVRGVFRVPARSVPQVLQLSEITLKENTVPLVSLWKKLGLGRALYTFPKEEKRILLVGSGNGAVGILVDQVLARQEVLVRPVEEDQRALFKGIVSVEKNALVVDIDAL